MSYQELYDEATKSKRIEDVSAEYITWEEEGQTLIGTLLGVNAVASKKSPGEYNQYLWDTDRGKVKCAFGRVTDAEAGALMSIGQIYAVEYLGQDSIGGGHRVNRFKIERVMALDEAEGNEES